MEYTWTLTEDNGDEGSRGEQRLRSSQGRNDFVGGIDNEALDFSQLEDFINDESENGNTYFVDTLGPNDSGRGQHGGTTVLVVETQSEDDIHQHRDGRLTLQTSGVITSAATPYTPTHNLPESPPDSGSEPPYSPQQDGQEKQSPHQKATSSGVNQQEILLHSPHSGLYGHVSLKPPHVHPVPPSHVHCEPMLIQHSVLTPLLTASSTILNSSNGNRGESLLLNREVTGHDLLNGNREAVLLSRNDTTILLNSDSQLLNSDRILNGSGQMSNKNQMLGSPSSILSSGVGVLNSNIGNSILLNESSSTLLQSPTNGSLINQSPQPTSPTLNTVRSSGSLPSTTDGNITTIYSTLQGGTKKRKLSQDLTNSGNGPILYVKQEKPESNVELTSDSNSNQAGMLDEEYNVDGNIYSDSSYQCIRFQPFQQPQWHVLCDQNLKELPVPHYRVDADKGFNFSNADDAFVCQKKNHFQITCHGQLLGDAQFVKTPEGLKKISSFYLHFYGVKVESPTQTIKVEQSQSDRSKKPFHPVLVELQNEQVTKVTVGRLHFSETTSNNMRKKGKPNPDQRYFYLVVGLHAHTCDSNYPVVSHASERIIVRASNPGQFESDVELCWQKGHTSESIYHAGKVGINTDRPDESLVVHGNLKVTGHIVQPSDLRAKFEVEECNTREQLKNIEQIRIVKYRYATEFAEEVGIKEDTGVIAQEIQEILPDAVQPGGDVVLPSGEVIENFLVVNKERIFMENVGAVKELYKVTDHLGKRIERVEKFNRRLAKLKNLDSFKSNASSSTVSSKMPSFKITNKKCGKTLEENNLFLNHRFCTNKMIHMTIACIVLMLALCLVAMATLYFLEIQKKATIMRTEGGINHKFHTSTIRNLHDLNKTSIPTIPKEYYNKDKNKFTTKLASLQSYTKELPKTTVTPEKTDMDSSPLPPPKSLPILGRPPDCGNSGPTSLYSDVDLATCQAYCCVLENSSEERGEPSHSGRVLGIQENPLGDRSLSFLPSGRNNDVSENSQPSGTNTIDGKKKVNFNKETSSRSKHMKKTIKRNEEKMDESLLRRKRDPDDLNEENSNFYLQNDGWYNNENGVSVRILAHNVNESLGPEYCDFSNNEYTHCIDRNAVNSTYHIPLSKYMSDEYIAVQFELKQQKVVRSCQKTIPQSDFQCNKRSLNSLGLLDSNNVFYVDIANYWSVIVKYRIPLNQTHPKVDLCELKDGLGLVYLEYNLHFYRDCEE
ncbi:hypothetical protein RUM43_001701 [Polyplax serrata]|uniref:Myelin regulatory factor n=1 Tax=Polyplax serrata TaxID=468196 RepID=A0AAN8SFV2_POLSC